METFSVCDVQSSDLPLLLELELKAHPHPWPESIFSTLLASEAVHSVVLKNSDQSIVGFAFVQFAADEASLLNIVVDPECQGQGLGRFLLNCLIDGLIAEGIIASFFLEVRVSNFSAIRLYLSCGFVEVGERRAYYETKSGVREDALIMALPLKMV